MDCVFCKIIAGQIPSNKVLENDEFLAFHDIAPRAPVHVLIIPKKHIENFNGLDSATASGIVKFAQEVAVATGVEKAG
ncbi:MAG: HIT domain-containing protein, partial [Campylobacter sp.]